MTVSGAALRGALNLRNRLQCWSEGTHGGQAQDESRRSNADHVFFVGPDVGSSDLRPIFSEKSLGSFTFVLQTFAKG